MAAYRSSEEEDVWRGRVAVAHTPASARVITRVVALVLLVAGLLVSAAILFATQFPSPRLLLMLGAVPSALWIGFRRRRHEEGVAERMAVADATARRRELSTGAKAFVVRWAAARDGKLVLGLPFGATLTLDLEGDLAARVVRALRVPDVGVRSVHLDGPLTSRLGKGFGYACIMVACTSALVLFSGSNLSTTALVAFGVLSVASTVLALFAVQTRVLVVDEGGLQLASFRRVTTFRYDSIEDLSLDGCTLTLKVVGESPQRFTLSTQRFAHARRGLSQHEMNTLAFNDAVAPMEMAARHLARVR